MDLVVITFIPLIGALVLAFISKKKTSRQRNLALGATLFVTVWALGVWFTFDLGNYDLNLAGVSDVNFVFGTGFDEVVLIPVPLALSLGLAGLLGVAVGRKRFGHMLAG